MVATPVLCWHGRFTPDPCGQPATWRGAPDNSDAFIVAWRACDRHKLPADVPLAPQKETT